jgi:hypothetical protein
MLYIDTKSVLLYELTCLCRQSVLYSIREADSTSMLHDSTRDISL